MDLNRELSIFLDQQLQDAEQAAAAIGNGAQQRLQQLKERAVLYGAQAAVSKQQGLEDADMLINNCRGLIVSSGHELALDAIGLGQDRLKALGDGLFNLAFRLLGVGITL